MKMGNKTIELIGKKCVQCHICETVCPTKSISFVSNEKGFAVPIINDACVNCGKCFSSCPAVLNDKSNNNCLSKPLKTMYGFANNSRDILHSSSGGIFYLLAKRAVLLGFDVISTVYSDDIRSCFYSNSNETTIEKMRQSKYRESNFSSIVERVSFNLSNNKKTFVCGTPCHINALRHKFGNNCNLFLVDFICHGVPSALVFNDMIDYYEKKLHGKINKINFRFKESKYPSSLVLLVGNEKKDIVIPWDADRFYFAFEKYWFLRDSCYFCNFIDKHSSDITLGDFWDGKALGIDVDNKTGCSLIFLNTKKGDEMLDSISNQLALFELPIRNHYSIPNKKTSDYNKQVLFFETYKEKGFIKTCDYLFFKKQKIKINIKKMLKVKCKQ